MARDVVQLVFRSALRSHGGTEPIELWLPQPPNGVIGHLSDYFGDCRIEEFTKLPESCQIAATVNKEYLGRQTHAGKLLGFLNEQADGAHLTPAQIREATGLTPGQFKEAKKHKAVQEYFQKHFRTAGSGKNTIYTKLPYSSAPTIDTVSA